MNKYLKKSLITGASLLIMASTGIGLNNVSASSSLYAKRNIRARQVDFGNTKHPTRAYYDDYSRNVKRGSKIVYIRKLNHEYYLVDLYHSMGNYEIPRNAVSSRRILKRNKYYLQNFRQRRTKAYRHYHHKINRKRHSYHKKRSYRRKYKRNKKHSLVNHKYTRKRRAKRIHKAARRSKNYTRKSIRKRHKYHKVHRATTKSTKNNIKQIENRLINDINNDRRANGVAPLQISSKLTALAKLRAQQMIKTGVTHYNKQGQFYGTLDAPEVGLPSDFDCGENAGDSSFGTSTNEDGHTSTNRTINDIADNKDNNMMNYDAHSNWGHRKNILDPNYTVLGVGASYDPSTQDYYEVEDFNDTNPDYPANNESSSDDNTANNTPHHDLPAGTVTDGNGNPISQAQQQHEHDKIQAETAKVNAQYTLNWDQGNLNDTLRTINSYPANKRQQIISGPQSLVNKDKARLQQATMAVNSLD